MCYYFDGIIKYEDFKFDNNLLNEKSYKNILIFDILHKTLIGAKPFPIMFDEVSGCIRLYDKTKYLILFALENIILFMTGLHILSV